jgi:hypothetical protein
MSAVDSASPVQPMAPLAAPTVATPSQESSASAAANWARKMKQAVKQQQQRGAELPAYLDSPVCEEFVWVGVSVNVVDSVGSGMCA